MEKQLSFVLMPSLEQMALRRIAAALYSEPRMSAAIASLESDPRGESPNIWEPACDEDIPIKRWRITVEDKMSELPKSLAKLLLPVLKAVGSNIFAWKSIHEKHLSTSLSRQRECFQKLCWTTASSVDHRRTAEQLVRFELACWYCLESHVPILWEKLPDQRDQKKGSFCEARVETPHLQSFLPRILGGQSIVRGAHGMPATNFFEEAAFLGNKTLAEYCFGKLTKEEREASLVRTAEDLVRIRSEGCHFDVRREKLSDTARVICCR